MTMTMTIVTMMVMMHITIVAIVVGAVALLQLSVFVGGSSKVGSFVALGTHFTPISAGVVTRQVRRTFPPAL